MSDKYNDFENEILKQIKDLAKTLWGSYKDAAIEDAKQMLIFYQESLRRWTTLLNEKKITEDDFKSLIGSFYDYTELNKLKQIGLAKVALDSFINGVVNIVISVAFTVFI